MTKALFLISLLTLTAVLGCGTLPAAMSSRTFNVTGFSLPVAMTFSSTPSASAQAVGISTSADAVRGFVMRTVMQAVFDVLEQQGRAAGLPDTITAAILNQLTVNISYQPLECKDVEVNKANPADRIKLNMDMPKCIIYGNTVTAICIKDDCTISPVKDVVAIEQQHLSISGALTTTNNIMVNWSRGMWQSVVNRVIRALSSGPLRSHFFSAVAVVS
ncbi:hypothetical protein KIN20_032758 [Parelaphostrongylus tenuis]|uniref:Uncharacterized protein n=1 Tax=Parelaphostrongylus tenuis TaxID=148309 RepID=A0AAD5R7J6_PARTN|nr:hypothetical protein KIN20_032758 [Parelaphostrongylus tenuis]